jgi:hypothetical protein
MECYELHCTVTLVIITDGWKILLLVMFKQKTLLEDIKFPAGIHICMQESGWMDKCSDVRLDFHGIGKETESSAEPFQIIL